MSVLGTNMDNCGICGTDLTLPHCFSTQTFLRHDWAGSCRDPVWVDQSGETVWWGGNRVHRGWVWWGRERDRWRLLNKADPTCQSWTEWPNGPNSRVAASGWVCVFLVSLWVCLMRYTLYHLAGKAGGIHHVSQGEPTDWQHKNRWVWWEMHRGTEWHGHTIETWQDGQIYTKSDRQECHGHTNS